MVIDDISNFSIGNIDFLLEKCNIEKNIKNTQINNDNKIIDNLNICFLGLNLPFK